ncbi:MAG: FIST C-terminal domain-containing protein [Pseudomonadota bacterium]
MKIQVFKFDPDDTCLNSIIATASFVAIHGACTFEPERLGLKVAKGQIHGATSCMGAMSHSGVTEKAAIFAIDDPDGDYGTGFAEFCDDAAKAARDATIDALVGADHLGETPDLVWLSSTPGFEEEVIAGIESVLGAGVPIIGGSAADDSLSGDWFVFDREKMTKAGVVVSVMFPSRPVSFAYHNGHAPTEKGGVVTEVDARRVITIDDRPAADVYREWTNGEVDLDVTAAEPKSILSDSTLFPLGRKVSDFGGVSSFLLAHPATVDQFGAIEFFANIEEGEYLTQMTGTKTSLVERAGRVAALARSAGRMNETPIAGALMVYCGGCMLSVRDRLDEVVDGVSVALDGAPFLGTFTFGEQGPILNVGNRHGNLMISCIVFG